MLDARADAQGVTSGIGLKPSLIEEGADPGEVVDKSLSITNLSDNTQIYYLSTRDIVTVLDGGTPVYAEPGQEKTGFELTEWLDLEFDQITLEPGEEKRVGLVINVPETQTLVTHPRNSHCNNCHNDRMTTTQNPMLMDNNLSKGHANSQWLLLHQHPIAASHMNRHSKSWLSIVCLAVMCATWIVSLCGTTLSSCLHFHSSQTSHKIFDLIASCLKPASQV